jgi:hypothetical protein
MLNDMPADSRMPVLGQRFKHRRWTGRVRHDRPAHNEHLIVGQLGQRVTSRVKMGRPRDTLLRLLNPTRIRAGGVR